MCSRDGRELFFISADQTLMVSAVTQESRFATPMSLFKSRDVSFDVATDGRFLRATPTAFAGPMSVVVNWTALLRK